MRDRRALFSAAGVYTLTTIVTKIAAFFLYPVYARHITPGEYGILGLVDMINGILFILLTFGLGGAVNRFYADYAKEPEKLKEYLGVILVFLIIIPFVFILLLDLNGEAIFNKLLNIKSVSYSPYIKFGVWSIYFSIWSIIPLSLLVMRGAAKLYFWMSTISYVITQVLIIYFVVWKQEGANGFLLAGLSSSIIMGIIYLAMSASEIKISYNLQFLFDSLKFSFPLIPHLAAQWALVLIDRYILEKMRPLSDVGIYSLGYQLALIIQVVGNGISNAWAPYFYMHAENATKEIKDQFGKLQLEFLSVITFIGAIGVVFSEDVVRFLFPQIYHESAQVIPVIILSYVIFGIYLMIVPAIFYCKQHKLVPVFTLFAAVVNIMLNLIWIPSYGIIGAAYATVLGYLALLLPIVWWSEKVYPINRKFLPSVLVISGFLFVFLLWATGGFNTLNIIFKLVLCLGYGSMILFVVFGGWRGLIMRFKTEKQ